MTSSESGRWVDYRTKAALQFVPYEGHLKPMTASESKGPYGNEHHAGHPRKVLQNGTQGQNAMRGVGVQRVRFDDHRDGHEGGVGIIPELPEDEKGQFIVVGLGAGLYIPTFGITFRSKPRHGRRVTTTRTITHKERMLMWNRQDIRVDDLRGVNAFLGSVSINSSFESMNNNSDRRLIEGYLEEPEVYGIPLAYRVARVAVHRTGLSLEYARARKKKLLPPSVPNTAEDFLLGRFVHQVDGGIQERAKQPIQPQLDAGFAHLLTNACRVTVNERPVEAVPAA